MSPTSRKLIRLNFLVAAVFGCLGAAHECWYAHVHYQQIAVTYNPFPYKIVGRAAVFALVELLLLFSYFWYGDRTRLPAGMIGVFGTLFSVVMPPLLASLYGWPIFTPYLFAVWYIVGSHMLYGFFGRHDF